mgnify:CR=1 FL=1
MIDLARMLLAGARVDFNFDLARFGSVVKISGVQPPAVGGECFIPEERFVADNVEPSAREIAAIAIFEHVESEWCRLSDRTDSFAAPVLPAFLGGEP